MTFGLAFEAADPPRNGRLILWGDGGEESVTVALRGGPATVLARRLPIRDAIPFLLSSQDPATEFWVATALFALHLVARGRLLPGVSPGDIDAWRAGPLDQSDLDRIADLVAAMPPEARAIPLASGELPEAETLIRGFLDAVADTLPRSDADTGPYAGMAPVTMAREGVRVSLRVEIALGATSGGPLRVVDQGDDRAVATDGGPLGVEDRGDHRAAAIGGGPLRVADQGDDRASAVGGSFRLVVQVHDSVLVRDVGSGLGPRAMADVVLALRRGASQWPALERLLSLKVPSAMELADDEVGELLGGAAIRLAAAGIEVHWPKDLARDLRATAVIDSRDEALLGDDLLRFDWRIALGGQPLTDAEMDELAEAHRPVVRLRQQWLLVDPELIRKARERELKPLTTIDALSAALLGTAEVDGEQVEVTSTGWLEALRERITDPEGGGEELTAPAGLAATLRDYQLRGLRWLDRMTTLGLGGCLADDMGLGKTITVIALHLHRNSGPTLVVCPASLMGNWEREIRRFAPGVAVHRFHGTQRSLAEAGNGFVLTTYGTMRRDPDALAEHGWGLLVADEAQHIKNPLSRTAKALRVIGSGARVALTGTPVENNLVELWAILDWTTPGLLGTRGAFRTRWATPIEVDKDADTAARFARLVRPFVLRRRKSDPGIAPELPPKTETDQLVTLTPEQAGLYEAVVRETMAQIRQSTGMARRGLVMTLLTALKQICNHPAQYLKEANPKLAGRSGKLELLDELVDTILAEEGAVLVFTQYVTMAKLIERRLSRRGVPAQLLHGGTPLLHRETLVSRFQQGSVPVFLLSLKAAGTGLNLTRADHVIHYDRWWNPAVEDQATDRAYRIGQTRPVQVHRLIAEGTIEDSIAGMLAAKRELADAVLGSGEAALTELSDAELAELVELRSNA